MFKKYKVVVIDDSKSIRTFLRVTLEDEQAKVFTAANAEQALDLCKKHIPDIVILDLGLPDRDGLDILPEIRDMLKNALICVLTVRKDKQTIDKVFELGADNYMSKPFMVEDLLESISDKLA